MPLSVVVAPAMRRLFNVPNKAVGSVLLPVSTSVPAPAMKLEPVVTPVTNPAVCSVPPAVILIIPGLSAVCAKVNVPLSVNCDPALNVSVEVCTPVPATFNCSDAACASATSTVTVIPGLMITASDDTGTPLGDQVAALLQLPEVVAVFCAIPAMTQVNMNKRRKKCRCSTARVLREEFST